MVRPSATLAARAAAASPAAIMLVVMLGNFLGPLYSSTANVIIPNLIASFGSDVDTMEWVVTGYMLGYSVSMPLAGWLADTFGRRRMFLIGLSIFTVFSILASLSWDATSLIAFRILQAVGGGIVSPTGMAIITDVIPPSQRGKAFGLWGMGMMLAPAFGPWISGMIVDNLDDWRPIFLLGVPIGIAGLIAAFMILPRSEDSPHGTRTKFDIIGFSSLAGALACFLIPLTQGNRAGWDDWAIRTSFIVAAILFVIFIVRELRTSAPMMDLTLFQDRVFSVAVGLRAVLGMGYYFAIFLLPLFTQSILGWDATQAGALLVPAGLAMALLMPISGTLADKIGARPFVLTGMAIAAIGTFLFARIDTDWETGRFMLDNAIRTGALGLLFTPLTTAALVNVPRNRAGAASGILNTVWQVGGSLGIAVGQTYLSDRIAARYNDLVSSLNYSHIPTALGLHRLQSLLTLHGLTPSAAMPMLGQTYLLNATVQAYGDTFLLGAVVVAVCVPIAFLLGGRSKA
ncbi:MAG: DHA2 family efflux MFS transporter permease subunit [Vulcanimicrobiaceae bacterium]